MRSVNSEFSKRRHSGEKIRERAGVALARGDGKVFQNEILDVAHIYPVNGQVVIGAERMRDKIAVRNARDLGIAVHIGFEHLVAAIDMQIFVAVAVDRLDVAHRSVFHLVTPAVVFAAHNRAGQIDIVCVDVLYRHAVDRAHSIFRAIFLIEAAAQPNERRRGSPR